MPAQITHVNLQYSHTIGRGEQFGPGFTQPVFVARGEDDLMYVLCRASEYRPEGTRMTMVWAGASASSIDMRIKKTAPRWGTPIFHLSRRA
jgi:hypothetical protein